VVLILSVGGAIAAFFPPQPKHMACSSSAREVCNATHDATDAKASVSVVYGPYLN
jgi:hypothetical protein